MRGYIFSLKLKTNSLLKLILLFTMGDQFTSEIQYTFVRGIYF
jgi:hypothetical protein